MSGSIRRPRTMWGLAALGSLGFAAIGALVWSSAAAAQTHGSARTRNFVDAAAQSDQFEILEAQAVLAQSATPAVRAFAQRMIDAHRGTSEALRQATAEAKLPPPPMAIGADQAALLAALQNEKGAAFDRVYAEHQALAHRSALTVEHDYATSGDEPALRRAAAAAVPVIEAHLAMAEQLKAAVGVS